MKKRKKILLIIGTIVISFLIYERYYLIKWYEFEIEKYKIEVKSDECDFCFLDWSIVNTIIITNAEGEKNEFELYTEGPKLEFGIIEKKIVINCPGFSMIFIDLEKLKEEKIDYEKRKTKLNKFNVSWIINNNRELIKLKEQRKPSNVW